MLRKAFTLIELLVVIAIIALLAAILFPVFAQVRESGRATACRSNLKQIASALTMYRDDFDGWNCRYRVCPDRDGDEFCFSLADQSESTGPNEMWWAPVDRQGKMAGQKIDFTLPARNVDCPGLLNPYVRNYGIFRCPDYVGQVGYAMSFINGGPMGVQDSGVIGRFPDAGRIMVVWDHTNGPGCGGAATTGNSASQRPPFTPVTGPAGAIHYPPRHNDSLNVLFYDGHAASRKPSTFRESDFRAPGSAPPANPPLPP